MPFGNLRGWKFSSKNRATFKKPMPALQKKQVRRMVRSGVNKNAELKYQYPGTNISQVPISTTGYLTKIPFQIPQGDGDNTRDGDHLTWCGSIPIRWEVINATTDVYDHVRVILFQWHPNDTTPPTVGNVLLLGPTGVSDIFSMYNHDRRQDYKILYDRTVTTVQESNILAVPVDVNYTRYVQGTVSLKKARKQVQFLGGGLTGTNQIYLLAISDSTAATHPLLTWSSKIFFRDS